MPPNGDGRVGRDRRRAASTALEQRSNRACMGDGRSEEQYRPLRVKLHDRVDEAVRAMQIAADLVEHARGESLRSGNLRLLSGGKRNVLRPFQNAMVDRSQDALALQQGYGRILLERVLVEPPAAVSVHESLRLNFTRSSKRCR